MKLYIKTNEGGGFDFKAGKWYEVDNAFVDGVSVYGLVTTEQGNEMFVYVPRCKSKDEIWDGYEENFSYKIVEEV